MPVMNQYITIEGQFSLWGRGLNKVDDIYQTFKVRLFEAFGK